MHTLRKIYCRTFQTVFKSALPFLPYRTPEIVPSVKKLPEIIRANGSSRVLIITDAGIRSLGSTTKQLPIQQQPTYRKHWLSTKRITVMP